jgi:hypothetical protein
MLKSGGTITMNSRTPNPELVESYGVGADRHLVAPDAAQRIDAGQIKAFIGTIFSLIEVIRLHIHDESRRTHGKLVLGV